MAITVYTWPLSLLQKLLKYFINICHVEIATDTKIFCLPVIATQEWMHILQTFLSCCGIAKMSHVKFAGIRYILISEVHILHFITVITYLFMHITENFGNSI